MLPLCTHVTVWGEVLRGVEARGHLQVVTKPKSGNVVQTAGVVVHLCGGFVRFCGENARRTIPTIEVTCHGNGRQRRIKEGAPQLVHVLESKNIGLHARLRIFDD